MANTNAPFGFRPYRRLDGAALSFNIVTMPIAYDLASQIGKGDVVTMTADGTVTPYIQNVTPSSDPAPTGVFWGCKYLNPASSVASPWYNSWTAPTLPSTTIVTAYVIVDDMILFEAQSDADGPLTQAMVGANFDINTGVPGTAGFSTQSVDVSRIATTAQQPLRLVEVPAIIGPNGYDPATQYNIGLFKLNSMNWLNTTGVV
jgi:hypothetical protein